MSRQRQQTGSSGVSFLEVDGVSLVICAQWVSTESYAPFFMAPLLIPILCDIGLFCVSPMIDRLWLVAMRAVGMMRLFSRSFAS